MKDDALVEQTLEVTMRGTGQCHVRIPAEENEKSGNTLKLPHTCGERRELAEKFHIHDADRDGNITINTTKTSTAGGQLLFKKLH